MQNALIGRVIFAATLSCALIAAVPRAEAQASSYRAPRAADGHPESQRHLAGAQHGQLGHRGAFGGPGAVRELGAAWCRAGRARRRRRRRDSVSAGGAGEEEGELREPAEARSGDQVLSAGRAARHLHAVSVPDHPEPEAHHDGCTSSRAPSARSTWTITTKLPPTAGWDGRTGDGKARRWSSTRTGSTA